MFTRHDGFFTCRHEECVPEWRELLALCEAERFTADEDELLYEDVMFTPSLADLPPRRGLRPLYRVTALARVDDCGRAPGRSPRTGPSMFFQVPLYHGPGYILTRVVLPHFRAMLQARRAGDRKALVHHYLCAHVWDRVALLASEPWHVELVEPDMEDSGQDRDRRKLIELMQSVPTDRLFCLAYGEGARQFPNAIFCASSWGIERRWQDHYVEKYLAQFRDHMWPGEFLSYYLEIKPWLTPSELKDIWYEAERIEQQAWEAWDWD